ncbi:MAG TPA: ParB/RepB/Spo0J family partition protein [Planctomycetes bacterium]|nr:ParB/RepB/Spo0J family partition protein [Planctomycetota bacterium]
MDKRLGRGLGSLLSQAPRERRGEIELDRIRANPFQPRTTFDEAGLEELRTSIEAHGVLQAIVVRPVPGARDGSYELVSGERRCRASRLAGKTTIPAVIRTDIGDEQMLELALVENLQRRDLDPMERARGFRNMMDSLNLTQEQVAERVGLKRSTVANHLRLLDLPGVVQEAVQGGLLSMGHARALLGVQDRERQAQIMEATVREGLSVREVERRVRAHTQPTTEDAVTEREVVPQAPPAQEPAWVGALEERLRRALGTRVKIQNGEGIRGRILIEYFDQASLESILDRIAPKPTL